MPVLGRDAILQADDIKRELVPVPEWGGEVWVKALTAGERDAYEASMLTFHGKTQEVKLNDARAKLAAYCICDETGKRIFNDGEVKALAAKSATALQRVFEAAQRLSGITEADVEELTKN